MMSLMKLFPGRKHINTFLLSGHCMVCSFVSIGSLGFCKSMYIMYLYDPLIFFELHVMDRIHFGPSHSDHNKMTGFHKRSFQPTGEELIERR